MSAISEQRLDEALKHIRAHGTLGFMDCSADEAEALFDLMRSRKLIKGYFGHWSLTKRGGNKLAFAPTQEGEAG